MTHVLTPPQNRGEADDAIGSHMPIVRMGRSVSGTGLRGALSHSSRRLILGVLCLIIIGGGAWRLIRPQEYQADDFRIYYVAAQAIRQGENPYAPTLAWMQGFMPGGEFESYISVNDAANQTRDYAYQFERLSVAGRVLLYAPPLVILLIPLTFLPFQLAGVVWGAANVLFLAAASYALLCFGGARPTRLLLLAVLALASLMSAVRGELSLGQANLFLLACVCGGMYLRLAKHTTLGALLLALAFVTKPMLLPIAVFLLWKREFKLAFTSIAGFLVFLLVPFVWLGGASLRDLLSAWSFASSHSRVFVQNVSPRGLFDQLFTVNPFAPPIIDAPTLATALWVATAALVLVLAFAVIRPQPLERSGRTLLELGVVISAQLLISPLTEPMYHVFLLVPWVALFGCLWHARRSTYLSASVCLLGLWVLELNLLPSTMGFVWRMAAADPLALNSDLARIQSIAILVATLLLLLHVLGVAAGTPTHAAVRSFLRDLPRIPQAWLRDLVFSAEQTLAESRVLGGLRRPNS